MERESFEDQEVAAFLNQNYVAIKVDREERPDVDHIYMSVCQALTGHGGWPLTIVMTAEQKPFFAGTYFPKHARYGHPGLMDVLQQLAAKWNDGRERIIEAGNRILEHMQPRFAGGTEGETSEDVIEAAYQTFREQFDPEYGGFGEAPKFPTPHNLMFLLRFARVHPDSDALSLVEKTLDAMYRGGIYDHVGFGFARYSTDRMWLVPHFEKMLYDNALLAMTYLEAYQATGREGFASVVNDIFTYVLRDMTDVDGGFYCAEDADSEGEEGKFYVWTPREVRQVLGDDPGERYCRQFDITDRGNFEGGSIPNLIDLSVEEFAQSEGLVAADWEQQVRSYNERLFQHREGRVHPHKDDKILTSWNGLMVAALAAAGRVLERADYVEAARRAIAFVEERLTTPEGRILARYRDGDAAYLGYVDDYAFTIWALIELYECTFDAKHLRRAIELQRDMLNLFWDAENGGFFMYGSDAESLIARPKEIYDGAVPSGNSVSALNLLRLARLTGQTLFEDRAMQLLKSFAREVQLYPVGYSFYLMALQFASGPTREIVVVGDKEAQDTVGVLRALQQSYLPNAVILFRPVSPEAAADIDIDIDEVAPFVSEHKCIHGKVTIYLCENFACQQPTTDLPHILAQLNQ